MKISEIRDPNLFQRLVGKLMFAEHGADYQTVDDSGGDGGLDGFVRSRGELHACYCPEKPDSADYKRKFKSDLAKAVRLRDEKGYAIDHFVFFTPTPLREPLQRELRRLATSVGFTDGRNFSAELLDVLWAKHPEFEDEFPELSYPRVLREVEEFRAEFRAHALTSGAWSTVEIDGLPTGDSELPRPGSLSLPEALSVELYEIETLATPHRSVATDEQLRDRIGRAYRPLGAMIGVALVNRSERNIGVNSVWIEVLEHHYPVPAELAVAEQPLTTLNLILPHTTVRTPISLDGSTSTGRRIPLVRERLLLLPRMMAGSQHSLSASVIAAEVGAWWLRVTCRATEGGQPAATILVPGPTLGIVRTR